MNKIVKVERKKNIRSEISRKNRIDEDGGMVRTDIA